MARYTADGVVHPVPPFDFGRSLAFLDAFAPARGEQVLGERALTKAVAVGGGAVAFRLRSTGGVDRPALAYTLFSDRPIDPARRRAAVDRLTFFLSLSDDLGPFYAIARDDPDFAPVLGRLHGYHQVKLLTPFENACWAVLTQRTPMVVAGAAKQALVRAYGHCLEVDGEAHSAFPEAAALATVLEDELAAEVRNARKGRYLAAVARAFAQVEEAWLRTAPYDAVEAWLRAIDGLGPWSAGFVLLRGLGRMERAPLTDRGLADAAARVYGDAPPMTAQRLGRLAERYGPWQGYWAHYLRAAA